MKKIIVTGNVGKDPEMRSDAEGIQFATFSVGISVGTKQNPKTDWVDVTCNGKLCDVVKSYVRKGSKLLIEGFPAVRAYLSREKEAKATLQIYAHNIEFLSINEKNTNENSCNNVYTLPAASNTDIPF